MPAKPWTIRNTLDVKTVPHHLFHQINTLPQSTDWKVVYIWLSETDRWKKKNVNIEFRINQ